MELKNKTNLIIILFIGVIFLLVEITVINEFNRYHDARVQEKAQRIFQFFKLHFKLFTESSIIAKKDFLSENSDNIRNIIEPVIRNYNEIKFVQVIDIKGNTVFQNGSVSEKSKNLLDRYLKLISWEKRGGSIFVDVIQDSPLILKVTKKNFVIVGILPTEDKGLVYKVGMEVSFEKYFQGFNSIKRSLIELIIILFLIVCAFLYYYLKSKVFNPMDEVCDRANNIESFQDREKPKSTFQKVANVLEESELRLGNLEKNLENTKDHVEKLNEIIAQTQKESEHLHRLASVGMISSGVSHEIGNPLGAISALVNSLSDSKISQEDKESCCKDIIGEIRRIEKIIKKVLNFSKFREENEEILDLHGLVDEAIDLCSYHKNFKKIRLEKEVDEEPVFLSIQKNQLLQVFVNIITNALDAMVKGGELKITSKILDGVPHQLAHLVQKTEDEDERNRMIDIMIMDTGKGIDENDLAKVFSPFFSKDKGDVGTGLGLYISYQIVRQFGGAIYAEKGEEGVGTVVHIQLPIPEQEASGS